MINTAATEEFAKVVRLGWKLTTVCDFGIWGRKDDEWGDVWCVAHSSVHFYTSLLSMYCIITWQYCITVLVQFALYFLAVFCSILPPLPWQHPEGVPGGSEWVGGPCGCHGNRLPHLLPRGSTHLCRLERGLWWVWGTIETSGGGMGGGGEGSRSLHLVDFVEFTSQRRCGLCGHLWCTKPLWLVNSAKPTYQWCNQPNQTSFFKVLHTCTAHNVCTWICLYMYIRYI